MALLKVSGLKKNFGKLEVLRGIDFELERGKALSIIGSSGSGKTTLLRCLNFLETPNAGTISVDDEVIFDASMAKKLTDAEMRSRRLRFGLVFQSFNLFPQYTVMDNLTLAPKLRLKAEDLSKEDKKIKIEKINTHASELLARIGLTEKADYYPCQLSGGQQQRVAIARALALSPDILCFDEPTSALDPELTGEVLNVIKDLKNQDHTMIIVTHEMEFAKNVSDQVIFMADGVIEEMGPPEQIFENPVSPVTKAFLSKSLENF